MKIKHIACGPFVNESEALALDYLKSHLLGDIRVGTWRLCTNLNFPGAGQHLPEEIDLIAIGSNGIHLIEIKHWDRSFFKNPANNYLCQNEANKLNLKAKRLAGKLHHLCKFDIGFITGKFLLTKEEKEPSSTDPILSYCQGIPIFTLKEWCRLLGLNEPMQLTDQQIEQICMILAPQASVLSSDSLCSLGEYVELNRMDSAKGGFHRTFLGRRKSSRDRVILHLYDLSATQEKKALDLARRDFEAIQRLQKYQWTPSLMDSFQDVPSYPGEMYFYSTIDPDSPCLEKRSTDPNWSFSDRFHFARNCLQALKEMHDFAGGKILHRNLHPKTILVRSGNEPLFLGFELAHITDLDTVSGSVADCFQGNEDYTAPEVLPVGRAACTPYSDIFSLCSSLLHLFRDDVGKNPILEEVLTALKGGMDKDPSLRASLPDLLDRIPESTKPKPKPSILAPEYWDEDTCKTLNDRHYRIVNRLGSGGIGTTFKVLEVTSDNSRELSGPYVAKVIWNPKVGQSAAKAYAQVRAQTGGAHLAGVLEVSREWNPNELTALLRWLPGDPFNTWRGCLPLYIEELGEGNVEEVLLRWLADLCDGLAQLHGAGLVHGDVTPKNIIVDGGNVTLTDYDLAGEEGCQPRGGSAHYCSIEVDARQILRAREDLFSLAASFFHVLFDWPPFEFQGVLQKDRGLNWSNQDRQPYPRLAEFLDQCTHPLHGFDSAMEARQYLRSLQKETDSEDTPTESKKEDTILGEQAVPWLKGILQSYPGSLHGNAETRGLDSEFSLQTYVETELDRVLLEEIQNNAISLVILCGNAGDGKTAFLQNLAHRLHAPVGTSADRLWDFWLLNGIRIRANLDASAAFQGRTAKQLQDEFFQPFGTGQFPENLVHLIAINDGPLVAWLESQEKNPEFAWLAEELWRALDAEGMNHLHPRIRFLDLNARSLVGGIDGSAGEMKSLFLEELIRKIIGEPRSWECCSFCRANSRCTAYSSVLALTHPETGPLVRNRFRQALQAVHQRGNIHITTRSLRAAIAYVFFGLYDCSDWHGQPDLRSEHYWDRMFDPRSDERQGDLLQEIQLLDPALDSHPRIDRALLAVDSFTDNDIQPVFPKLASLRRRAFFEWPESKILQIGGDRQALGLARGRHLETFLKVGSGTDDDRRQICDDICKGIARLEDLPECAFQDPGQIPLRITPRTPTETIFWATRPRSAFSLEPYFLRRVAGMESLPTHVLLHYRYSEGHQERLYIDMELFYLLMEMKDGFQLTDSHSDDIFANLSIFRQRLVQEEDQTLFAWNPMNPLPYKINLSVEGPRQPLKITPLIPRSI